MSTSHVQKLKVIHGNICQLPNIDVIVNAAKKTLLGGGGVDGAIHKSAGPGLREECAELYPNGCETSDARLTGAHDLKHAKAIIHTVGPDLREQGSKFDSRRQRHKRAEKGLVRAPNENDQKALKSCYTNSLDVASNEKFESIAFCGISTGLYGYPQEEAAELVVKSCLEWFEENPETSMKKNSFLLF